MQQVTYDAANTLKSIIAEAQATNARILAGNVALLENYTLADLRSLVDTLSGGNYANASITDAINLKCVAFFTDLKAAMDDIITTETAAFTALADGDGL